MIETYEGATLTLDGEPFATAERAENGTAAARTIAWTQPIHLATGEVLDAFGEIFGVMRHEPVRPSGTATVHLGGILRVVLPIAVTGADPAREDEHGTTVTMHAEADPKAWRRAVSMAVEQAIVDWHRRVEVIGKARGVPALREHASAVHWKYPGERKRRKAMRRLLRAAGVTVQATTATCLDGLPPDRLQPHERGLLAPFLKSGKAHEWKAAT